MSDLTTPQVPRALLRSLPQICPLQGEGTAPGGEEGVQYAFNLMVVSAFSSFYSEISSLKLENADLSQFNKCCLIWTTLIQCWYHAGPGSSLLSLLSVRDSGNRLKKDASLA